MATTYRGFVRDDNFRTMGQFARPMVAEVARRTPKTDQYASEDFAKFLARNPPLGPKADAWLEVVGPRGSATLIRLTGHVTVTALGRDGYSRVPAGGEWRTADGTVFAGPTAGLVIR